MGMGLGLSSSGGGGNSVVNRTVYVPTGTTGTIATITRLFTTSSTFALGSGTNANLTRSGLNLQATASIAVGASQEAIIEETDPDGRFARYKVTCTGYNPSPSPTPTLTFPALSAKVAAGQRAQLAVIGDSAVAGWGSGVTTGTGSGSGPGNPGNYSRYYAWPQQLARLLAAAGIPTRSDAYFSSASDTNITNLQAANPNIVLGSGWILGNLGLSGTILQCPNTSTATTTFTPEIAADNFELLCSSQTGLGTITVSDSSGWSQTINTADQTGAQVIVGAFGLKRFTATRPTPSTLPISIARNGTGNTVFVQGIIPFDSTSPCLEILTIGWPGSRAYGTDGSTGHWNIWAIPSNMNASTPYNSLGVLNSDAYILELGTNDAAASISAANYESAMNNIASKLKTQAGNNGANVALVKCRTTIGSFSGFNMTPDMLAAVDTVTSALSLSPIIDFNSIAFTTTTDRFDGTHLSAQGYGKEAAVAKTWLTGS